MKKINEITLSKLIDNLDYSIKPVHYKEFKKNLIKILMDKFLPDGTTFLQILFDSYKHTMEKNNIRFSPEELLKHTVMMISLMHSVTSDDYEYNINCDSSTVNDYMKVLYKPFNVA